MQAIVVNEFGSVSQLKMQETPLPDIKETQLLIEQYATSINPSDYKKRKGLWGGKLPYIPGGDAAGIVVKIGEKVTNFQIGDRVMANATGTYAQFAVAREAVTVKIPDTIPFTEAAGLPLAGQAAYQALFSVGKLQQGEKVLIQAGAGGVGSLAIQMAKDKKAVVVTTASKENEMFLYSLGAETVIDYHQERLEEKTSDIDLVVDSIGGKTQKECLRVLKKGGRLISLAGQPDEEMARQAGVKAFELSMKPSSEGMAYLGAQLDEYKLRSFVHQVFPFTELGIQEAQTISESGHVRGKIIVVIKEERQK